MLGVGESFRSVESRLSGEAPSKPESRAPSVESKKSGEESPTPDVAESKFSEEESSRYE